MTSSQLSQDTPLSPEDSLIGKDGLRMTISQIRQEYAPDMQTGTIRNRLRDGSVPLEYASSTYNLSTYTSKQIISILSTSPKPRPDTIETQHGGDVKAYQEALHRKAILNKSFRR